MRELLPCPFCGSTQVSVSHTVQGSCWVVCDTAACGAIGPTRATPAEAAAAWNTRVGGDGTPTMPEPTSASALPEVVLPVEIESRLIGDVACFRARDVELHAERDPLRPCLGRALDAIAGDLILVQISGPITGGFAWAYARRRGYPTS